MRLENIKRQTRAACGCLAARSKVSCVRGLAYGLEAARPLFLWQSAAAAAVCGAVQVMGLYL